MAREAGAVPIAPTWPPPLALRRRAAADGGGSCLSPNSRQDRCLRCPAAGMRPAGRQASRPARGWGGVRVRGGQPGAGRRWRGYHGNRGFIFPILTAERATIPVFDGLARKATVTVTGDELRQSSAPLTSPQGTFTPQPVMRRAK